MKLLTTGCFHLGSSWCLDFQHAVHGSTTVGQLNVYQVVNGIKGNPLYTKNSNSVSRVWERTLLTVDGTGSQETDMIEVKSKIDFCLLNQNALWLQMS